MKTRVTIKSSLKDISIDIAKKYLLRGFPAPTTSKGELLDYSAIRKQPIDKTVLQRPIHGYQNACRVATLIEVLFDFYKEKAAYLPKKIQEEIKHITDNPLLLKYIQIVGLMRATGRTKDGESGSLFAEQGRDECLAYLKELGIKSGEASRLAELITLSEGTKTENLTLSVALLADATLIETFRDGVSYDDKTIPLEALSFYRLLRQRDAQAIEDIINLSCAHAGIIIKHQGYIYSAFNRSDNIPISNAWPITKKLNEAERKDALEKQRNLEHDKKCYDICRQDVKSCLPKKDVSNIAPIENLFQHFEDHIRKNNIKWNNDPSSSQSNAEFVDYLFFFMQEKNNQIIKIGKEIHHFDWDRMLAYLANKYVNVSANLKDKIKYLEGMLFHRQDLYITYNDNNHQLEYISNDKKVIKRIQNYLYYKFNYAGEINKINYNMDFYTLSIPSEIAVFFGIETTAIFSIEKIYQLSLKSSSTQDNQKDNNSSSTTVQTNATDSSSTEADTYVAPKYLLIKAIRADNKCFIDDFISGITATKANPDNTVLRMGAHKKYTAYIDGVTNRRKKLSPYSKKQQVNRKLYSKHQATTLAGNKTFPSSFSHDSEREKEAGFIFDADDAYINRAFTYNVRSVVRPYESNSLKKVTDFYNNHIKDTKKLYEKSTDDNQYSTLNKEKFLDELVAQKKHNEILAKIRWQSKTSTVAIFSNTLESRCLAQFYADQLLKTLQRKMQSIGAEFNDVDWNIKSGSSAESVGLRRLI